MKKLSKISIILCLILIITLTIILLPKGNKNLDDNTEIKNNDDGMLSIMLEKSAGSNEYIESTETSFKQENYNFNAKLSKCINGSKLKYNEKTNNINVETSKTDKCYLYFDNINVKTNYTYTGNYETYIVPSTGTYKIELWGASGGNNVNDSANHGCFPNSFGRGAYTSGNIELQKGEKLYIYVGETRIIYDSENLVFNGGGPGESDGGGASDIRLEVSSDGLWNNFESLKSRIMVAAGGGGCAHTYNISESLDNQRGDGGALTGLDAKWYTNTFLGSSTFTFDYSGHGATQTSGGEPGKLFNGSLDSKKIPEMTGKFGSGGYGIAANGRYTYTSSGGGGGYYGGGHGNHPGATWTGGGGGSSFISGYPGCNAIDEKSTEENIIHTNQPNHYSGKIFTETEMIAGNTTMPKPDGGTEVGHTGNGYARITFVK